MISKTLTNNQTLLERSKNNELTALQKEISIKSSNKEKEKIRIISYMNRQLDNGFPILDLPVSEVIARDCRNAINDNNDLLQVWLKENKLMLQKEITNDIYYIRERSLKSLLFFKNTYEAFDEAIDAFILYTIAFLALTLLTSLILKFISTLISHIITGFTLTWSFNFVLAGLLIFMLTILFKKRFYTL